MATCANGHEVQADKRFCPTCGAPVVAGQFCTSCGATVRPDGRFCETCGASTERPAPDTASFSVPATYPAPAWPGEDDPRATVLLPPPTYEQAPPPFPGPQPAGAPSRRAGWIVPVIVLVALAIGTTTFFLLRGGSAKKGAVGTTNGTTNGATSTTQRPAPTPAPAPLTTSPTTSPAQPTTTLATVQGAFVELDADLRVAVNGRSMVNSLVNEQNQNCVLTPSSAASQLNAIIANRNGVALQAQAIASSAQGGLAVATELAQAMQTSIDADNSWSAWFTTTYQSFFNAGCRGKPATNGDPNWDQFAALSRQADAAKMKFVSDYNAQAAGFGLKADWKFSDL